MKNNTNDDDDDDDNDDDNNVTSARKGQKGIKCKKNYYLQDLKKENCWAASACK